MHNADSTGVQESKFPAVIRTRGAETRLKLTMGGRSAEKGHSHIHDGSFLALLKPLWRVRWSFVPAVICAGRLIGSMTMKEVLGLLLSEFAEARALLCCTG